MTPPTFPSKRLGRNHDREKIQAELRAGSSQASSHGPAKAGFLPATEVASW
jgi:hypothetical protein